MFNLSSLNINTLIDLISSPSFETLQLGIIIYIGLLWLSVIIWVTRDAINRSDSIFFQVIAILLNILFPILGILLYLIIRPGKTTVERYYEDLEHKLILDSVGETEIHSESDAEADKSHKKKAKKEHKAQKEHKEEE